jgi:hypothetical protein
VSELLPGLLRTLLIGQTVTIEFEGKHYEVTRQ